jgi:anaerobic ribonucleoside-triphosphate reductase activating protein
MTHDSGATLRIGHISEHSSIYGPGVRFVIWTQGCTLACEGCWNKQYWPSKGGTEIQINALIETIASTDGIQGITLLGGEPLQQSQAVLEIIHAVRQLGLSVFLYTGYGVEEFDETMQACFDNSDMVVTGRYIQNKRDTSLRWRGSTNQIVHHPSGLYSNLNIEEYNEVEFVINEDGAVSMFGYPDAEMRLWVSKI